MRYRGNGNWTVRVQGRRRCSKTGGTHCDEPGLRPQAPRVMLSGSRHSARAEGERPREDALSQDHAVRPRS